MKQSELRQIIREEISKVIKENSNNEDIITQAIQQFDFDLVPKDIFQPLKDYLMDEYENEDNINISTVIDNINFMEEKLGGIKKVLIRKGYY
jgi:hypothetical protein